MLLNESCNAQLLLVTIQYRGIEVILVSIKFLTVFPSDERRACIILWSKYESKMSIYLAHCCIKNLQCAEHTDIVRKQGRINHCAGCTMGGGFPPPGGPRSTPKFLPHCFNLWTFIVGLNITTTTKKVVNFFWEEKRTAREKVHAQRKSWLRVWEKDPRFTLAWGPRMANPALSEKQCFQWLPKSVLSLVS